MIEMILFLGLAALNAADMALTLAILKRGGRELNPVMRFFIDRLGRVAGLVVPKLVMLAAAGAGLWVLTHGQGELVRATHIVAVVLLAALCCVYGFIVVRNMGVLKGMKK